MKNVVLLIMLSLSFGCATVPDNSVSDERDPFESTNRDLWAINYDVLDKNVVRPSAVGYEKLGTPVRNGIRNVLLNIEEPLNAVNNLLQGKVSDSGSNLGRFLINTTVGLLGVFDPATNMGIAPKRENFSQTLGAWGIGNEGPYLMVPLYGPATPRSIAGDVLDNVVYPMTIMNPFQIFLTFALSGLESRVQLFEQEPLLNQSLDPYNFVKEVYFQNDQFRVTDGNSGTSVFDSQSDDEAFFEDEELLLEDEID
ncbi:MlaA family lipoprotein [Alteromonas gracilis]|uniref:MlaA family lipoprotein n=1 Tax=Alteromonas gracilis TaxID=1479524 RepID=UPI0030D1084A